MIPYEDYKCYGPYERKDGRRHVVLVHNITKQKKTVSYPKYKMELKLGKYLEPNEEIHHINEFIWDDREENLQIINKIEHKKNHQLGNSKYLPEIHKCAVCGKDMLLNSNQVRQRVCKQIIKGPYCSRQCQGKECN